MTKYTHVHSQAEWWVYIYREEYKNMFFSGIRVSSKLNKLPSLGLDLSLPDNLDPIYPVTQSL